MDAFVLRRSASAPLAATLRPLPAPSSRLISLPSENAEINPAGDAHNAVTQPGARLQTGVRRDDNGEETSFLRGRVE